MNGWHRVWDADLRLAIILWEEASGPGFRGRMRLCGRSIQPMPTDIAKYSIELFKPGGEGAGIEDRSSIGTPTSRSPDQSIEPASRSFPGD